LRGWKDYTKPITIEAVTVETLPVDIKAQTIGNIAVDIAAQTLAQLNVNIAASAITLQVNIASVTAGVVFNVAQSGSWTVNAAQTGTWTINIGAPLDAGGNLKTAVLSSVQLDVNIAASAVTLNVAIQSSAVTLNVDIVTSAVPVGQAKPAVGLNGSTSYISVPHHADLTVTSEDFTIVRKIKARSISNSPVIFCKGAYTADGIYLQVFPAGYLRLHTNQAGAIQYTQSSTGAITLNEDRVVHVTRSGASVRIYVDGVDKTSIAGTHVDPATNTRTLYPDCYEGLGNILDGVDYFTRFYKGKAFTAAEVAEDYANPNSPITSSLKLWLKLDEGTGTTAKDSSGLGHDGTLTNCIWLSEKGKVSPAVAVNIAASAVTLNVNISSVTSGVTFNVAQSGTWTINAAQSGTWTINIGGPLDASGNVKTAILSSVQLNVNIAASAVTLNVNISSQSATLNVAVTGTANVNITSAIVNISSVRLMDSGTIKRVWAQVSNGTSTMYTVPTGKKFYIYSAALNVLHYGTGSHLGYLTAYDGTTNYHILYLSGPDSVDNMHDAIGFNVMSIPAGWSVYVGAGAYSTSIACVIGVEVTA
jgi:hypothetical protein